MTDEILIGHIYDENFTFFYIIIYKREIFLLY